MTLEAGRHSVWSESTAHQGAGSRCPGPHSSPGRVIFLSFSPANCSSLAGWGQSELDAGGQCRLWALRAGVLNLLAKTTQCNEHPKHPDYSLQMSFPGPRKGVPWRNGECRREPGNRPTLQRLSKAKDDIDELSRRFIESKDQDISNLFKSMSS